MEKLTLEHLAPYLPYKIKYIRPAYKTANFEFNEIINKMSTLDIYLVLQQQYKPILRPLSDLTKEKVGELFGGKYTSEKCMLYDGTLNLDVNDSISINLIHYLPQINKLFEHHFDVFGLIDKGLAIDVNTL